MSATVSTPSDLPLSPGTDRKAFPFRCELSLAPLITFWTQASTYHEFGRGPLPGLVRDRARQAPALAGVIHDLAVIEQHKELVDLMMTAMFPPALWEQEYAAALLPFELRAFYATPAIRRSLMERDGTLRGRLNLDGDRLQSVKLLLAYELILRRTYGIDLGVEVPVVFTSADPATGLDRHFQMQFDWRFVEVEPTGVVPALAAAERRRLQAGLVDLDVLRDLLPSERFAFRGFAVLKMIDVTDQEVLSSLKRDLIDKESIVSNARFRSLQAKLRTFFRRPDVQFGLAAVEGDNVLVLNDASSHEHACIFADSAHHKTSEFAGSLYERAVVEGRPVVVDDLAAWPDRTRVEDELIASGIRNFVCAPLHYQDEVIGTLELVSPNPGDLNATHLPKLDEILPLFSMAVQRSVEELDTRIQAFIKAKCTAIHPTVEWRFRKAVLNAIERHKVDTPTEAIELEPIVFEGVYPLYALADIRGSSEQRARAIQADLLAQLDLARTVVRSARQVRSQPALDELGYRIDQHAARIETGISSGDEVGVIAFLRTEVESLFGHLAGFGRDVRSGIETYRAALDARLGAVYRQRRLFEDSVTAIADAVSSCLDVEQPVAQDMYPHYFEKQKTDGVDYQMYVGPCLLEDGRADPLCLQNLRLWQLITTCAIAARTHQLRDGLAVPLETTHLVLVQHAPLSIRFRFDEKRFDVDGAYDIRYEIIKKRIDKALVRGSTERVTQPGAIAIVYSQPGEALEYRGYIEYLQSLGYLKADVEQLELEELQGVHGLRAIRVSVDLGNPKLQQGLAREGLRLPATPPS